MDESEGRAREMDKPVETSEEEERKRLMEERLAKDWGPQISPHRRRLSGIFIIMAFIGLVLGALLMAP